MSDALRLFFAPAPALLRRMLRPVRGRIGRIARRFGPTMLTTLASQGVSAAALFTIILLGPRVSDQYALAIQVGASGFSGLVQQVLYYIAIGRPWMRSWTLWSWISAAFSVVFSLGVVAVTAATTGISPDTATIVLIFGIGGAFLALTGVIGVRLACVGRPMLMVGVTIIPNLGLGAATVAVGLIDARDWTVYLPAVVWTVASAIGWLVSLRYTPGPFDGPVDEADSAASRLVHATTLSIGLVGATIYPSLFIAALAQLPAGTTTVLFLVSRIGTSLVGLLITSVLAVRFNWHTEVASTAKLATWITGVAVVTGTTGIVLHSTGGDAAGHAFTAACWLASLFAAPFVLREMHARRMVAATSVKTFVDLAFMLTIGTWFLASPSISGFFGVYVLQQAVTLGCAGIALRKPALTVAASALLVVSIVQILSRW